MSDERWIELQYQILACRVYNTFKDFPEATEFLRTLSKLGGNTSTLECDKMLANCLTKLQLPFLKEAIAVTWQHKGSLKLLAKVYNHYTANLYQLKNRTDLEAEYPPIFDQKDREQMKFVLYGYERIGGVIL